MAMVKRLEADLRYRGLSLTHRHVVQSLVLHCADGTGHWWNPVESKNPAKRSMVTVTGCSASTVKRALRAAETEKLLIRTPYLRPDGFQGTSNYFLAADIVLSASLAQGGSHLAQLVEKREQPKPKPSRKHRPARWVNGDLPASRVNSDPAMNGEGTDEPSLTTELEEACPSRVRAREGSREAVGDPVTEALLAAVAASTRDASASAESGIYDGPPEPGETGFLAD